jgi:hypothetical protein
MNCGVLFGLKLESSTQLQAVAAKGEVPPAKQLRQALVTQVGRQI